MDFLFNSVVDVIATFFEKKACTDTNIQNIHHIVLTGTVATVAMVATVAIKSAKN